MSNNIIRQQRLINLQNALNSELKRRGLSQKSFTIPIANITPVKTTDITDIRTAINQIKTNSYTDNIEPNKTVIKDVHFSELENKINTLATHPLQGGTSDCNSVCTGMCTSCTSCSGCSTCQWNCGGTCNMGCGDGCNSGNDGGNWDCHY